MLGAILGGIGGGIAQGAFNSWSADRQMDFQRNMSNTAYQRAAKDLEKAGLNRILALGNAASTPSGASATMNMPDLGATTTQAASAKSTISLQEQQKALMEAQKKLALEQADNVAADTELKRNSAPNIPFQGQHLISMIEANQAGIEFTRTQQQNLAAQLPKIVAETRQANANASEAEFKKALYDRLLPYLKNVLDVGESNTGPVKQAVTGVRDSLSMFLGDIVDAITAPPKAKPKPPRSRGTSGKW